MQDFSFILLMLNKKVAAALQTSQFQVIVCWTLHKILSKSNGTIDGEANKGCFNSLDMVSIPWRCNCVEESKRAVGFVLMVYFFRVTRLINNMNMVSK